MKLNAEDLKIINNKLFIKNKPVTLNDIITFECLMCGKETKKRAEVLRNTMLLVCGSCLRKQTNISKYGVENVMKNKAISNKGKDKKLIKYGSYNNINKIKKTNISKYGVENVSQIPFVKEKKEKTCIKNYGAKHIFSRNSTLRCRIQENKKIKFYQKLLNNSLVEPFFDVIDYENRREKYKWKCKKCGNIFEDHINNGHIPRCFVCFPKIKGSSKFEDEIKDFILSLNISNIIENSFSIIKPLQLDIYLPDYKLAIEFDGLYWHSELNGKDKNYHLNKTLECQKQGIQLLHIFEDEWVNKQEIVKSIIIAKLGFVGNRLYARKCIIKELDNKDAKDFYDSNHLQGKINSKINIGLFYKDELVSCLSFGKSRYNKKYDWEITRYANKLNTSIIGGFNKLLKYFLNHYKGSIITYSDKRLFSGDIYRNNGFTELKPSNSAYFYIKSPYCERYNRQQFQKHKLRDKLTTFDPSLTEWENMQLNGWDRIWDCGNYVFELIV